MNENVKGKIKKAAEGLMIQRGYKDTTIQDIATNAKVAVGTIYRYYKSKDDILLDIDRMDLKEVSYSQDIRRKEIMEAALNVFGTKGYSRTNIEDIANEIGMSKASIYQHFRSKEELFISTIKESSQMQALFKLTTITQETVDIEEVLNELGRVFLSIFDDPRRIKLMRIIIGETPNFPEIGELFFHEIIVKASEQIAERLAPFVSGEIDLVLAIRLFIGSIWSFVIFQEMAPMKDNTYKNETIIKDAIQLFQHGITSKVSE